MTIAKRNAFLEQIHSGKANKARAQIYKRILSGAQTNSTLKIFLRVEDKNQFSGRITELLDMGLIKEKKGVKESIYKAIHNKEEQEQLIKERQSEKYAKWYKKGLEMDWINTVIQKNQAY